jgi:hypothetical protein
MIFLSLLLLGTEPTSDSSGVTVEKKIIYQKETSLNFEEARVEGENQLPPAFFVTKMNTPKGASLLEERLRFKMRDFNELGF